MTPDTPEIPVGGIDLLRTLLLATLVCAALVFSPEAPRPEAADAMAHERGRHLPEVLVREEVLMTPLGQDVHPHL